MRKIRRKWLSILLTLAMLVGLMVPFAGTAVAGTTYEAITAVPEFDPTASAASNLGLATVYVKIDPSANVASSALVEVIDSQGSLLDINSLTPAPITGGITVNATSVADKTYKLELTTASSGATEFKLNINVDAKNCAPGEVKVRFYNATGQLINGTVVAAYAKGAQVELAALEVPAFGDAGATAKIRIKEAVAGGLKAKSGTIKLKLPVGFTWEQGSANVSVLAGPSGVDSTDFTFAYEDADRTLKINYNDTINAGQTPAIVADLTARIKVDVSTARIGDVVAAVSGESTVIPSELTIGTYGEYKVTLSTVSLKTVQPGQLNQEIGKFAIEEALPGTLIAGRTIVLTLPEQAKWYENNYPTFSADDSSDYGSFAISSFQPVGTDGRTIKATVTTASSGNKPTKLVFKGGKITVQADYVGDIVLTVSGSAGANGTVKVAEAKAPVTVTASSKPTVIIGQQAQAAAEVTLTETKAEAIKAQYDTVAGGVYNASIEILTPPGVRFAEAPTFTVTDGDLQLGTVVTDSNWEWARVNVKSTSSKPSTIKISNIKLIVDRTVPEGDIELKIGGTALVENDMEPYFPNVMWAAKVPVAKVTTPAPPEQRITAVFKVGDTKYTVNGVEYTMDVAPYVKDGRTYLPVRYVAYALGVDPNNVYWNDETQTVTLLKGAATSVQLTIGSKVLKLNGYIDIPMDAAPEVVDGRTMVPFRFVAQALGAQVSYDEATQTVTMNL